MKTTFGLILGLGILVAGTSGVAHAGGYYSCRPSRAVVVTEPACVQYSNDCSTYGYRYYTYPRYQSWKYGYSKPRGWFGYRYYYKGYRRY